MSKDNYHLSRRKVLGGIGTIGLASAGAGLGTSAYFSDTESFEANTLTAGELDLKVDWEEHYSYPQLLGFGDPTDGLDVTRQEPGDTESYVPLPTPQDPLVWVHEDDRQAYMDNTSIEAYPDENENGGAGDGIQDDLSGYDACTSFADMAEDLDPDGGSQLRTANADTLDGDGNPKPLVSLEDIKPGDFGELTLSFHLCDNPGYVWLQGDLVYADENDHTEPEASAPDETGNATDNVTSLDDAAAGDIELLDEVQTMLWYDEDGDNVYEPGAGTEPTDVMLVFDKSESMNGYPDDGNSEKLQSAVDGGKSLVDALGGNIRVGLTVFADAIDQNTGVARSLGSAGADIKADLDGLIGPDDYRPDSKINDDHGEYDGTDPLDDDNLNFETQTGVGINAAREELLDSNPGSKKVMVILSDGNPVNDALDAGTQAGIAKGDGIEIYTIAYGGGASEGPMENWASDPKDTHAFVAPDPTDVENVFGQLGQIIGGEQSFFRGSLRELLDALSDGMGIPLDGDRTTAFDEESDPADDANREEFVNSTNNFIGLSWWVPRSVGNHIQSDSVGFDLGFYTEQSRHNDGSGQQST